MQTTAFLMLVSLFSAASTGLSRNVLGLFEASLSDGKNYHGQIHFSQKLLLLQTVQEKTEVRH